MTKILAPAQELVAIAKEVRDFACTDFHLSTAKAVGMTMEENEISPNDLRVAMRGCMVVATEQFGRIEIILIRGVDTDDRMLEMSLVLDAEYGRIVVLALKIT